MNKTLIKIWWGKSTERVLWKGKKMIESQKKPPGTLEDGRALWDIGDDDKKREQKGAKRDFPTRGIEPRPCRHCMRATNPSH
jgi:hypothetical protein